MRLSFAGSIALSASFPKASASFADGSKCRLAPSQIAANVTHEVLK
jgi:hypothetical protein